MFKKNIYILIILIPICISLIFIEIDEIALQISIIILSLAIIYFSSDPIVYGINSIAYKIGVSEYTIGIISSISSNLPEAILATFMAFHPELREIAILTIMLASAFNGLLLGILVVIITRGKKKCIVIPREELEWDIDIMRLTIAFSVLIFGLGIILNVFQGSTRLPSEASLFLLLAYIGYLYFMIKSSKRENMRGDSFSYISILELILGLAGLIVGAELISSTSEKIIFEYGIHPVVTATIIAFAGSVPEHGIAILGARKGYVKFGVSNLVSGIVQSIMLIFPIISFFVEINLDGYILYQFLAIAVTLWLVKKAIVDDGKLTLDEGIFILLAHLMGIILFDELTRI